MGNQISGPGQQKTWIVLRRTKLEFFKSISREITDWWILKRQLTLEHPFNPIRDSLPP